jgi:hypothetical protein
MNVKSLRDLCWQASIFLMAVAMTLAAFSKSWSLAAVDAGGLALFVSARHIVGLFDQWMNIRIREALANEATATTMRDHVRSSIAEGRLSVGIAADGRLH